MRVVCKTTRDKTPQMQKSLRELNGKKILVGFNDSEMAWLGGIHEYGCRIPVTPKMRAFLHHNGIHLRKSTTVIIIPERSFLRAGHDSAADGVLRKAEHVLPDVVSGHMSVNMYCRMVGELMASAIKEYAVDLDTPPNSGWTVAWKGSSNPLVDTGNMIGSIDYEVE